VDIREPIAGALFKALFYETTCEGQSAGGQDMAAHSQLSELELGDVLRIVERLRPDFDQVVAALHFDEEDCSRSELETRVMGTILVVVQMALEPKPKVQRQTLDEIARDPRLIEIAPDHFLDLIAEHYRRDDGKIGAYWVDIYGNAPLNHPVAAIEPAAENVTHAATEAAKQVPRKSGRPAKTHQDYATRELSEIFRAHRGPIKRRSVETVADGRPAQKEAGEFRDVLEIVLLPFNTYFERYDEIRLNVDTMVEKAIELQKTTPGVFPIRPLLQIYI
jgi:hypothetical protein